MVNPEPSRQGMEHCTGVVVEVKTPTGVIWKDGLDGARVDYHYADVWDDGKCVKQFPREGDTVSFYLAWDSRKRAQKAEMVRVIRKAKQVDAEGGGETAQQVLENARQRTAEYAKRTAKNAENLTALVAASPGPGGPGGNRAPPSAAPAPATQPQPSTLRPAPATPKKNKNMANTSVDSVGGANASGASEEGEDSASLAPPGTITSIGGTPVMVCAPPSRPNFEGIPIVPVPGPSAPLTPSKAPAHSTPTKQKPAKNHHTPPRPHPHPSTASFLRPIWQVPAQNQTQQSVVVPTTASAFPMAQQMVPPQLQSQQHNTATNNTNGKGGSQRANQVQAGPVQMVSVPMMQTVQMANPNGMRQCIQVPMAQVAPVPMASPIAVRAAAPPQMVLQPVAMSPSGPVLLTSSPSGPQTPPRPATSGQPQNNSASRGQRLNFAPPTPERTPEKGQRPQTASKLGRLVGLSQDQQAGSGSGKDYQTSHLEWLLRSSSQQDASQSDPSAGSAGEATQGQEGDHAPVPISSNDSPLVLPSTPPPHLDGNSSAETSADPLFHLGLSLGSVHGGGGATRSPDGSLPPSLLSLAGSLNNSHGSTGMDDSTSTVSSVGHSHSATSTPARDLKKGCEAQQEKDGTGIMGRALGRAISPCPPGTPPRDQGPASTVTLDAPHSSPGQNRSQTSAAGQECHPTILSFIESLTQEQFENGSRLEAISQKKKGQSAATQQVAYNEPDAADQE